MYKSARESTVARSDVFYLLGIWCGQVCVCDEVEICVKSFMRLSFFFRIEIESEGNGVFIF